MVCVCVSSTGSPNLLSHPLSIILTRPGWNLFILDLIDIHYPEAALKLRVLAAGLGQIFVSPDWPRRNWLDFQGNCVVCIAVANKSLAKCSLPHQVGCNNVFISTIFNMCCLAATYTRITGNQCISFGTTSPRPFWHRQSVRSKSARRLNTSNDHRYDCDQARHNDFDCNMPLLQPKLTLILQSSTI